MLTGRWALRRAQVQEVADVSAGGVFLPDSAKERPMAGTVVRTGPGKMQEDGVTRKAPCVAAGDQARPPPRLPPHDTS